MLDAASKEGVEVTTVLTTHKHWDHAGGNNKIKKLCPGIEVIGGINDHVEGCTRNVKDGEQLNLGDIAVTCIETPGCAGCLAVSSALPHPVIVCLFSRSRVLALVHKAGILYLNYLTPQSEYTAELLRRHTGALAGPSPS